MYFTGFADEASRGIDGQIKATKELGWKYIESRMIDGTNLTWIDDKKFDEVCAKLEAAGIKVNCFGSAIANWSQKITEPPERSYEEIKRAIPRMKKLGAKMIRIMSFDVPPEERDKDWSAETIKRVKVIAKAAEDGGVICVHENCSGWGGFSYEHSLRLINEVKSPALKLVFDTGNPMGEDDIRGKKPYKKQDSLEFYRAVKQHIIYVHIKDGVREDSGVKYTFPGEGMGHVKEIIADLLKSGYDGGFSIEPHMKVVVHDKSVTSEEELCYQNYVEYGRRLEKLIKEVKK